MSKAERWHEPDGLCPESHRIADHAALADGPIVGRGPPKGRGARVRMVVCGGPYRRPRQPGLGQTDSDSLSGGVGANPEARTVEADIPRSDRERRGASAGRLGLNDRVPIAVSGSAGAARRVMNRRSESAENAREEGPKRSAGPGGWGGSGSTRRQAGRDRG
jgi:hypothetical protein